MDTLFIIKILAVVISGVLGLLSAVSDFREKDSNRFTRVGRFAIALIIVSLFVAVGADLLSHRKDISEKREADRKHAKEVEIELQENTRLLTGIYESSVPLGLVDATLSFDLDYEAFPSYAKRLTAAAKTWKPGDPHFSGFSNTDLMAPGVPQPTTKFWGRQLYAPVASDEIKLSNSLKPKPNTATIRVHRGDRRLEGSLKFGPSYQIIPKMEQKRLLIEYIVPHVEWSNPTKEDVSLFNLGGTNVDVIPDFHPLASLKGLRLRVPASNHRLIADLVGVEASGIASGTLKAPSP